jgi:hypothetical protein
MNNTKIEKDSQTRIKGLMIEPDNGTMSVEEFCLAVSNAAPTARAGLLVTFLRAQGPIDHCPVKWIM